MLITLSIVCVCVLQCSKDLFLNNQATEWRLRSQESGLQEVWLKATKVKM